MTRNGRAPYRAAQGLTPDVRLGPARQAVAGPPGGAGRDLPAGDRSAARFGCQRGRGERAWSSRIVRRWISAVDPERVLDPPRDLPLRARGGLRRAAPLDHPRRAPRPSERSAAARDAALGEPAALVSFPGG